MRMLGIALILAVPLPVFYYMISHPQNDLVLGDPESHFYIVSMVTVLSMLLAAAVLWASRTLPDPRTWFLAMGFLAMATIFLAHGLGTSPLFHQHIAPGDPAAAFAAYARGGADQLIEATTLVIEVDPITGSTHTTHLPPSQDTLIAIARAQVVGYSARLCMLASALFFALAVVDLPGRLGRRIVRHRVALTVLVTVPLAGHVFVALW